MPIYYEGRFDFEEDLLFQPAVLGSVSAVAVGGVKADVLLPSAPTTPGAVGLAGGELQPPPSATWKYPTSPGLRVADWGLVMQRLPGDVVGVCEVWAAVFRLAVEPGQEERVTAFAEALVPWFSLLCAWLGAGTGQNLTGVRTRRHSSPPIHLVTTGPDGKPHYAPVVARVTGVMPDALAAITTEKWRRALAQASSDCPLPVEHQLLTEAQAAIRRGATRESVIAAGSAAEVALNAAIRARLRSKNEDLVIHSLLKGKTLGRIEQVAKLLEIDYPRDLTSKPTEVRNGAVHRGEMPSRAQAVEALRLASEVVDRHSPLPW